MELLAVDEQQARRALAADLWRGGYVRRLPAAGVADGWYFDKALVLSRPGLVTRAARLSAELIPEGAERLATASVAATVLAGAIAQRSGLALLLGSDRDDGSVGFAGESFRRARTVLVEDVVHTGDRAATEARALVESGAEIAAVLCLLDRQAGAAQRLARDGHVLRALFTEAELLDDPEAKAT